MNYEKEIDSYSLCSCGAVTLYHRNGKSYSCDMKNRSRFLPGLDLRKLHKLSDSFMCNHCVNRWGIDLCACGSGEFFWECSNGLPECGQPMQEYGVHENVIASDSWLSCV